MEKRVHAVPGLDPGSYGSGLLWSPFQREAAARGVVSWQPPAATTSASTTAFMLRPFCPRVAQTMTEHREGTRAGPLLHTSGSFNGQSWLGSPVLLAGTSSELNYSLSIVHHIFSLPCLPSQMAGQHRGLRLFPPMAVPSRLTPRRLLCQYISWPPNSSLASAPWRIQADAMGLRLVG